MILIYLLEVVSPVAQAGLKLAEDGPEPLIFLPLSSECCDSKGELPFQVDVVMEFKPRLLCELGKPIPNCANSPGLAVLWFPPFSSEWVPYNCRQERIPSKYVGQTLCVGPRGSGEGLLLLVPTPSWRELPFVIICWTCWRDCLVGKRGEVGSSGMALVV